MKIKDIMTRQAETVELDSRIDDAARAMKDLDVGAVPVCEKGRLKGIVTDRDLVVRILAEGRDPAKTRVCDIMSEPILCCLETDDVEHASRIMREHQVRRIPVVDDQQTVVGMISLGDLAVKAGEKDALRSVSEPARPSR